MELISTENCFPTLNGSIELVDSFEALPPRIASLPRTVETQRTTRRIKIKVKKPKLPFFEDLSKKKTKNVKVRGFKKIETEHFPAQIRAQIKKRLKDRLSKLNSKSEQTSLINGVRHLRDDSDETVRSERIFKGIKRIKSKFEKIESAKKKKRVEREFGELEKKREAIFGTNLGRFMFEDQEKVIEDANLINFYEDEAIYKFKDAIISKLHEVGSKKEKKIREDKLNRIKNVKYKNNFKKVTRILNCTSKMRLKLKRMIQSRS